MDLKVCGLRESGNIAAILDLHPEWIGFIFVPSSPRYYGDAADAADIITIAGAKKIGVFVNQDTSDILDLHKKYRLDMVQLHGDEAPDTCRYLKEKGLAIIKAFRVNEEFDFSTVSAYTPYIDLILFDTSGNLQGGNGITFDWSVLGEHRFHKLFLLSGGIGPESLEALKNFTHPDMIGVDVNSRFETSPGVKDVEKLKLFKQQIS
jgi:phosphoribosylanthranilate isomerase